MKCKCFVTASESRHRRDTEISRDGVPKSSVTHSLLGRMEIPNSIQADIGRAIDSGEVISPSCLFHGCSTVEMPDARCDAQQVVACLTMPWELADGFLQFPLLHGFEHGAVFRDGKAQGTRHTAPKRAENLVDERRRKLRDSGREKKMQRGQGKRKGRERREKSWSQPKHTLSPSTPPEIYSTCYLQYKQGPCNHHRLPTGVHIKLFFRIDMPLPKHLAVASLLAVAR
ncbi:hypothetical protein QBC39DRAFT_49613 [Podospora conica]|nr:hypothetical protein QBC39DRAFT_49613 [Schizothecium conicum]